MTLALNPHFTVLGTAPSTFWVVGSELNARYCPPAARAVPGTGPVRGSGNPGCDAGSGQGCTGSEPLITIEEP
jgi:hypothetical protein